MLLMTQTDMEKALGHTLGKSTWQYCKYRLHTYKKKPEGKVIHLNAMKLSSILKLLAKDIKTEPIRNPAMWRLDYDGVVAKLKGAKL